MTPPPSPESKRVYWWVRAYRWVLIALLALFLSGIALYIAGMLLEQRDRVAMPGIFLSLAAIAGAGVYGLLLRRGTLVVKSYWGSEREWRDKREVPVRYWLHLIGWSACCIFSVGFAGALLLGVEFDHPSPPSELSAPVELWMVLIVVSPGILGCICAVAALRNLRPDADYRPGKLLLPRHVTSTGLRWLVASYLLSAAFIVLACLSPLIVEWLE